MPKLLILSSEAESYRHLIEAENLPDLNWTFAPASDVDIVLGEPSLIKDVLASLSALCWVQSIWAGVEPLLDPAIRRDYILTNARGVFGGLMSEFVVGYMLMHERRMLQKFEAQKNNHWDDADTGTLRGKTLGLLGVGSIGADIARTAKFFGMNVRGYTRESETSPHVDAYYHAHPPLPRGEGRGEGLLDFASGLDYLVSILPNTKDTRRIVNADLLDALPPHAFFINVGRGQAVDESALIEALNRNRIAGAVLDVFEKEPLPKDHPFWTTPNLLMTFHTSAPSLPEDITKIFIENYKLFIEGKPLKYQVNFERGY
jgi:phosphoglycerate dehydrogenase-like enzyme